MKLLESILSFFNFSGLKKQRKSNLKATTVNKISRYKLFSMWETLIFVVCVMFFLLLVLFFFNDSSLNTAGIKALKSGNFQTAQNYFKQNIEKGSLNSPSYLNLALSYDLLKQALKSLEVYKIISDTDTKDTGAFFSYFNQAELYGRLGNLESALKYYQLALKFEREEKKIKTNIELLFKQTDQDGQSDKSNSEQNQSEKGKEEKEGSGQNQSEKDKEQDQKKGTGQDQSEKDKEEEQKEGSGEDQSEKDKEEEQQGGNPDQQQEEESDNNGEDTVDNEKQAHEKDANALTAREQKAILEEIQKQENKVRAKIYQNKQGFGDKTKEDW